MICSTRNWPTPAGTFRPVQIVGPVCGSAVVSSAPSSKARTRGVVTSDCTQIIFGRRESTRPSASSSSKAFHMPSTPVPPPVG